MGEPGVQVVLEDDDVAASTERLLALGATVDRGGPGLLSPGGWPFTLSPRRSRRRRCAVS